MKLFSLVLAVTAGAAMAACPNKCSGHGSCGSADLCTCQARWTGADCSLRECPYGLSWTVEGTGIVPGGNGMGGMHPYTECSSKGVCDTSSGECQCFEGYEGRGCRRQACPNDCSGNGRCVYNNAINGSYTASAGAKFSSQTWDAGTRVCVCDRGYEGYDCSSRICPKGDDPVTDCSTGGASDANSLAHNMVQRLYVLTGYTPGIAATAGHMTATGSCIPLPLGVNDADGNAVTGLKFDGTATTYDANASANVAANPCNPALTVNTNHIVAATVNSAQGQNPAGNIADGSRNYFGYISLKYTDMFGGEYFTRPILIDTTAYATQTATEIDRAVQWAGTQGTLYQGLTTAPDANNAAKQNYLGGNTPIAPSGTTHNGHTTIGQDNMKAGKLKRYTADRIRDALQSLPNFAIPQVNVTNYDGGTTNGGIWGNMFDITFGDHATAGKQKLLECVYDTARACDGAQPKMANQDPYGSTTVRDGAEARANVARTLSLTHLKPIQGETTYVQECAVYEVPLTPGRDYEENAECSNRGLCDSSTGTCSCFEGHTGENCAVQTVFF